MSIDSTLGGITSLTNQVQTGIGTALNASADLGLPGLRNSSKPWYTKLQKASFRGVEFDVLASDSSAGRRIVVHEYPYRDDVWPEDMGKQDRRFDVTGYLVTDANGDCIAKRDAMLAACERKDDGDSKLVHPTYGELTVTLLGHVKFTEQWDKGRMFELSFSFVEASKKLYPTDQQSTANVVVIKASRADVEAAMDFKTRAALALKAGAAAVQKAVNLTTSWTTMARRLTNDATNLVNLVSTIGGAVGRFANGRNVGGLTSSTSLAADSSQTVASLIARGSSSRAAVNSAIDAALVGASSLSAATVDGFSASVQVLVQAVADAATDPADAVRLLSNLAQVTVTEPVSSSAIGMSQAAAQVATADLLRRAAVVAMARAALAYQPASVEDAAGLRARICQSLDDEITIAGDAGADGVYNSLRALRAAVSADLAARGAGLPQTMTVTNALPLPSLVLAQRLYRDSGRADELVTQSGCVHPAFMPTNFKALSQ